MTEPVIEIRDVTKSFAGVRVLGPLSLSFLPGEVHAVAGENGSGKSTLMKIVAGLYQADSGSVLVDGQPVAFRTPHDGLQCGIAMISQDIQLVPSLSVGENIMLNRPSVSRWGKISWKQTMANATEAMEEVGLSVDPRTSVGTLPPDLQQLVAIARAVSADARVIIMDEPTAVLGEEETHRLFAIVSQLRNKGVAILYVSHRLKELFALSDRVTILRDGGFIGTEITRSTSEDELVRMMVGRPIASLYQVKDKPVGDILLEVTDLQHKGLQDIDLTVRSGEVLGIAGLTGCGRSDLLKAIYGAYGRVGGSITLDGRRIAISSPADAIKNGIVFIPSDRRGEGIVGPRSVDENILMGIMNGLNWSGWVEKSEYHRRIDSVKSMLEIKMPFAGIAVQRLSGGNQQKVVLGRWMTLKPRVFLFDEPTQGIDVGAKAQIYEQLHQIATDGCGIVISSSELPELLGVCDRILVMARNRIVAELVGSEATEEAVVAHATAW